MLQLKHISKTYGSKKGVRVTALDDVTIDFPERGLVFVVGKSGCGKSTLLNVCGGLDRADSGEIIIMGRSSRNFTPADFDSYRNTYVGFVFQDYNILGEMTVGDNISVALELQGGRRDNARVEEILKTVELEGYAGRKPNTLSGGQKQRVAIARALVKNPRIILADEPTGALDSQTGRQVLDMLKKLSQDKLVIVVSHDMQFAESYADRIIELKDGKVVSDRASSPAPQEREYSDEERMLIRSRLPVRYAFRMGAAGIKTRPVRLAFTIFLCLVAFIMFGMFSTLMFYSPRAVTAEAAMQSDIGYLRYQKAYRADWTQYYITSDGSAEESATGSSVIVTNMSDKDYAAVNEEYGPSVAIIDDAFTVDWYCADEYNQEDYFYTTVFSGLAFADDGSAVDMLAGRLPEGAGQAAISDFIFSGMMTLGVTDADGNKIVLEDYGDYTKLPVMNIFGTEVQIVGVYAADDAAANKKTSLWFDEVGRGFYTYLLVDRPFVQEYLASDAQSGGDDEDVPQQTGGYFTYVYDTRYVAGEDDYITGVFIPRAVYADCIGDIVNATFTVNDDDSTAQLTNYLMSSVRTTHSTVRELQRIFLGLWLGFTLFAALLMANFISASISSRRREIGILRAIGARGMDVFKIFLFESLIVAAVCLVLSAVVCAIICPYLSLIVSSGLPVKVLRFTPLTVLFMALVAGATAVGATAVPVAIYSGKPPVDSMRAD